MGDTNDSPLAGEVRSLRRVAIAIVILLVISVGLQVHSFVRVLMMNVRIRRPSAPVKISGSWRDTRDALERGDFVHALSMARELASENPDYYYGHVVLGIIHLARGEVEKAEKAYQRAYELFPTEENREALEAVRARLEDTEEIFEEDGK